MWLVLSFSGGTGRVWAGVTVGVARGDLSNPDEYGAIATRLSRVFPDFQLEVFENRHHFDPPHRIEPERLAESLKALWRRADQAEPDARPLRDEEVAGSNPVSPTTQEPRPEA